MEHATLDVAVRDVGALMPGGKNQVVATISGPADTRGTLQLDLKRRNGGRTSGGAVWFTDFILKGGPATVRLGYDVRSAGEGELLVSVVDSAGTDRYRARCSFSVPPLHAADFGWKVPSEGAGLNLWWCTATEKVGRERPAPRESKDVALEAAANEEEAFQLILRPDRDLENVRVRFTAPAGLPVTTRVREVAYVNVKIPTDYSGSTGPWPDPLPDHEKPVDCSAGTNQPFWLSVRVGPEAAAGNYTLQVLCEAAGREVARIPVKLRVFGFALPKAHSINTAFGFSAGVAARYHHVRSDADRRKLFDLYMQNFRDHRISTYSFAPYDPIKVSFSGYQWEGDGERVTENPATGAWCLRLADDSATRNIASTIASFIAIREGGVYTLSWKVRSAADAHPYLVTLDTYNRKKQWLSGHNIDLAREAGKTWRSEKARLVITDRSPDARFVKVVLRATAWDGRGTPRGTVWFDDVSLREPAGPELIQDGGFEGGAGSADVSVDFEAWGRQGRRYLDEYAFDSFRLRLRGLGGGTFHSRRYGRIGPYRQGTEDYRMLLKRYASQVEAYLTAQGWLDKAFIYWFDEPQEKDYDFVKEGMREIRLAAPGLKRMLTEEPNDRLAGFVDIWCPVLHNAVPERISERIAAGETVWWYVCTGPKAPYLGLFTDHPATDLRVWLWLSWKYGVTGILVWQSNYWTSPCAYPKEDQDPWQDPMSYVSGYGRPAGFVGYWGNGDGRFIYPPRDRTGTVITGPVDSIRWEMLREGIEDYEYLALLKRLIVRAKAKGADISTFEGLLQVPGDIIRDGKTYTRSAAPIYRRRHQVAEAIELLRRR